MRVITTAFMLALTTQAVIAEPADFLVTEDVSPMTDDPSAGLMTSSEDVVHCVTPTPTKMGLYFYCGERKMMAGLATECMMPSSGNTGLVEFRADGETMQTLAFDVVRHSDLPGLRLTDSSAAIEFANAVLGHEQLLIRFRPYGDEPELVTFNITGIADAIVPLREACGW